MAFIVAPVTKKIEGANYARKKLRLDADELASALVRSQNG
jgi:hypothetical protein